MVKNTRKCVYVRVTTLFMENYDFPSIIYLYFKDETN